MKGKNQQMPRNG